MVPKTVINGVSKKGQTMSMAASVFLLCVKILMEDINDCDSLDGFLDMAFAALTICWDSIVLWNCTEGEGFFLLIAKFVGS